MEVVGGGVKHASVPHPRQATGQEEPDMSDNDVATDQRNAPSMEEILAEQRQRLEQARQKMHEAAKDPENREALSRGKGHGGGSCLHL
jgi:hypothetical protein